MHIPNKKEMERENRMNQKPPRFKQHEVRITDDTGRVEDLQFDGQEVSDGVFITSENELLIHDDLNEQWELHPIEEADKILTGKVLADVLNALGRVPKVRLQDVRR